MTLMNSTNCSGERAGTLQGASIKNNPLEKMLYFSHGSMDSNPKIIATVQQVSISVVVW